MGILMLIGPIQGAGKMFGKTAAADGAAVESADNPVFEDEVTET